MTPFVTISLTRGLVTIVDPEDFPWISRHKWTALESSPGRFYAFRTINLSAGNKTSLLLHRAVLDANRGQEVDHINWNTLDNRKSNLRFCSRAENFANKRKMNGKSQFKGVSWSSSSSKWMARIQDRGTMKYLGVFESEEEAAQVYDKAALTLWGEFARPNFSCGGIPETWKVQNFEVTHGNLIK